MTKTTMMWLGKAAVLAVVLAVAASLVLSAMSGDAEAKKKKNTTPPMPSKTYKHVEPLVGPGGGASAFVTAECDPEDIVLGGGGEGGSSDVLLESTPSGTANPSEGWTVEIQDNGAGSLIAAQVICADRQPVRSTEDAGRSEQNQERVEQSEPEQ